jgi:hypothetical protein
LISARAAGAPQVSTRHSPKIAAVIFMTFPFL